MLKNKLMSIGICNICKKKVFQISPKKNITSEDEIDWEFDSTFELSGFKTAKCFLGLCLNCIQISHYPEFDTTKLYTSNGFKTRRKFYRKYFNSEYNENLKKYSIKHQFNFAKNEFDRFKKVSNFIKDNSKIFYNKKINILDYGGGDGYVSKSFKNIIEANSNIKVYIKIYDPMKWRKSNGKYIAFLDSDDYWHKEKLKDCLKYFPQYDFVYNLMKIRSKNNFYYNNKILYSYQLSDKPFIDMMTKGNPISTSSVILKKSLINEKKFFSEEKDFLAIEDFDCWIKLSRKNIKFKMVNSVLGFYNMSNYSYSSYVNNKKNNYNLNKIYLKNLKFIKNHKIEKISKNHFRYLMANNCRNVRYKLLVYKSLLFKVTPKISKFKLILKILFFQFLKND